MAEFGHFSLCIAWLLCIYGIFAGAIAGKQNNHRLFLSARNATIGVALALGAAITCLGLAFYNNDYTSQFVWQFSNRSMPTMYKVSAIWGGMDGSMLLWAFILSLSSGLVARTAATLPRTLAPWVISVLNTTTLFFTTIVLFFTNPFRYIQADFIPPDGNGLNPLLQNPYMAIHPPMLYLGFTTFAIPFAFCMAALISAELSNEWVRLTRRWTLLAWGFLTVGIVLGGHWAYLELGWGGFWAWDPVENASFLPWLTGTAFLHSVMIQERKNMLKIWNIWLIITTFLLTVFGTFLTRSGIVQSVHAFASTDFGWVFLAYIGCVVIIAAFLTYSRKDRLKSERRIESLFSREAAFLMNNLLFLSICFAVLWGVMFPVLSEGLLGIKQTVGIPFFNRVTIPLFLLLLFLMGVGPLIAWRKASWASMRKTFVMPFSFALALAVTLVWAGVTSFYPVLAYAICAFVVITILGEIHRGAKAQRGATGNSSSAFSDTTRLLRRHRNRYAGYLVHFGVVVATIGITASMAHKSEKEFTLGVGESIALGRFTLTLDALGSTDTPNYNALIATTSLKSTKSGELLERLAPELRFYDRNKETTTEVALRIGAREDFYLVLAGLDESQTRAAMKVFINPLQVWLWVGAIIMTIGTGILLLPERRKVAVSSKAKEMVTA